MFAICILNHFCILLYGTETNPFFLRDLLHRKIR